MVQIDYTKHPPFVNTVINEKGEEIPQNIYEEKAKYDRTECFKNVNEKHKSQFCQARIEYLERRLLILEGQIRTRMTPYLKRKIQKAIDDINLELKFIHNPKRRYNPQQRERLQSIMRLHDDSRNATAASASSVASAALKKPKKKRRNMPSTPSPKASRRRRENRDVAEPVSATPVSVTQPTGITIPSITNADNERLGFENLAGETVPFHNNLPNNKRKPPSKLKSFFSKIVGSKKKMKNKENKCNKKKKSKSFKRKKSSKKTKSSKKK